MEAAPRTLSNYVVPATSREPFQDWIRRLDRETRARIRIRLNRVQQGNFGKHRVLGGGLIELKMDFGPGYRVYLGERGEDAILLCGGDKDSQESDIKQARKFWEDFNAEEQLPGKASGGPSGPAGSR